MGDLQPITDAVNRVLRKSAPAGEVPRERMQEIEQLARERYPEATRIVALWTPASECDVTVEVWTGEDRRHERANVVPADAL